MDFPILYQDDSLLVIDKPAGVVVNQAQTVKKETVQSWVEDKFRIKNSKSKIDTQSDFLSRAGIVHRLDKETSGCLIIAKTEPDFIYLQQAFKERKVNKEYIALLHGKLQPKEGNIDAPVGRVPWNRQHFGVVVDAKPAHTRYLVDKYYKDQGNNFYTLARFFPTTGRTHQLRVHAKYLGFPIVGDYLYAGRKLQKSDRKWCPRVFLHAISISFPHPTLSKNILVSAALPKELAGVLSLLTLAQT